MRFALLSSDALAGLAESRPPMEAFGPDSDAPLLAFELAGADPAWGPWLQTLPCPVIGVGDGALAAFCDVVLETPAGLETITANVRASPLAAMILVQTLRASEHLPEADAMLAESLAFGVAQAGPEFRRWRVGHAPAAVSAANTPPLLLAREGGLLRVALNRPAARNAIGVDMRDALAEAFDLALLDDEIATIELSGRGPCFSVGGEVREFGLSEDPATAHWVRTLRLPARRLPRLRRKLTARVHGAVIGAGLEIAAFAGRVVARPDAWFQLPELKYGLIPGAGGTVSLPRRIGRQRTALLALSMQRLSAKTAHAWGLVDAVED